MISLPEKVLHDFRVVARRTGRGGRSSSALFHLLSGKDGIRIQSLNDDVHVEYHDPTRAEPASLVLPMSLLMEFDKGRDIVEFHRHHDGNVEVRWQRSRVPYTRSFAHGRATPAKFPVWPTRSTNNPPSLLDDIDQAMQILSNDRIHHRYSSLRLRGSHGDIAATDGRQMLLQRGYQFPWKNSLLVPRTLVFGSPELPSDVPVRVGFNEEHVLIRIGAWTIALKIDANSTYPNVDALIPSAATSMTQCVIAASEAEALQRMLHDLPGDKEDDAPVTLDVNGKVTLRARAEDEQRCTDVPLPRSTSEGAATRIAMNRQMLQRALALGFRTVEIRDAAKPLMCLDEQRTFVWAPLNSDQAVAPQRNPIRITLDSNAPSASPRINRYALALPQSNDPFDNQSKPCRSSPIGAVVRGLWSLVQRVRRHQEVA